MTTTRDRARKLARRMPCRPIRKCACQLARKLHPDFDYEKDNTYQEAQKLVKDFKARDGVDYAWVAEYARHEYDRFFQTADTLDAKADSIVSHLGVLSAFLTLAAGWGVQAHIGSWLLLSALPAFVAALLAMATALKARSPIDQPFPPSIEGALKYAEWDAGNGEMSFIPQIAAAAVGMKAVVRRKAQLVHAASVWFARAILLLLLPVGAIAVVSIRGHF